MRTGWCASVAVTNRRAWPRMRCALSSSSRTSAKTAVRCAAVARVVARRLAPEALVENGIGIVRLHAVAIGADVKLAARLQREPLGRLHLPERRVDADALQLTDHEGRQIGERRQSAREHLDLEGTRRPE